MLADLQGPPANPSSVHWFGQQAKNSLHTSRQALASFLNAKPEEIIFTSGGTESINLLLRGLHPKGHLITTAIEHASAYRTIQILEAQGLFVTYLPVGLSGAPLPSDLEAAIKPDTQAIFLSAANSETGVKIDLQAISAIAQKHQIPLLLDAIAYIGKEPLILYPGISGLALSGHKFHAPKGVGALFARSPLKLSPLFTGGNQEQKRRAGTENLAGILGLAAAIDILRREQPSITQHLFALRTHFETGLLSQIPDLVINGLGPRTSNTVNFSFPGVDGETLLMHLDLLGLAVSHGSACSSGALEPSRVLINMGVPSKQARSSLRFSLSRMNTYAEIERALSLTTDLVKKLRS